MAAFGYPAELVVVVPHGLDPSVGARPTSRGRAAGPLRAAGAGRPVPGHHLPAQEPRRAACGPSRRWAPAHPTSGSCSSAGPGAAEDDVRAEIERLGVRRSGGAPRSGARRRPRRALRRGRGHGLPQPLRGLRRAGARGDGGRAARWSRPTPRRCPRSSATPPSCSIPDDVDGWAARWSRLLDRRRDARPAGPPPGRARARDVHADRPRRAALRRAPTVSRWSVAREARRPLPALRARRRADGRGDDEHRRRAGRARPSSCTSSRRCPGTSTTGRAGVAGRLVRRRAHRRGARITRVHPFPTDKRDIPRRALAFGGFTRSRRRRPVCEAAGSTACSRCRRRSRSASPAGRWRSARRAPLVFNIQDVFPDVAVELGVPSPTTA